jgi:hypothetical protein
MNGARALMSLSHYVGHRPPANKPVPGFRTAPPASCSTADPPNAGNMSNPWTSKNPFMSMWLSAANRSAGIARGKATSAAKRQIAAAQTDAMRQVLDFWSPQPARPASRKKARR